MLESLTWNPCADFANVGNSTVSIPVLVLRQRAVDDIVKVGIMTGRNCLSANSHNLRKAEETCLKMTCPP